MKFSEIASKYSENTPLRLTISSIIPVFGPSIDLALSSYADKIYKSRVERSLNILNNELRHLNRESLNKDFINSEAFFDIFRLYLEKAIRTRQEKKVQYYAQILTETIRNPEIIEQSEQDIKKISSLSLQDMLVMKYMYDKNSKNSELFGNPDDLIKGTKMMKVIPNNLPDIQNLDKSEIEKSMSNLISMGFVHEYSGSSGSYGGGWYFVTPLLKEIMKKLMRFELS